MFKNKHRSRLTDDSLQSCVKMKALICRRCAQRFGTRSLIVNVSRQTRRCLHERAFQHLFIDHFSHTVAVRIQPAVAFQLTARQHNSRESTGFKAARRDCGCRSQSMEFTKEITGVSGRVEVLALICPDPKNQQQTPVLVGTNTSLFRRLWDLVQMKGDQNTAHSMRIQSVYAPIRAQEQLPKNDMLGQIKWKGPRPLSIAPGANCYATCKVDKHSAPSKDLILIDAPSTQLLPAGVLVQPGVLSDAGIDSNSLNVLLQNESTKTVSIPVGSVIAEMFAVDTVTPVQPSDLATEKIDPNLFDFGDSPIPEEWGLAAEEEAAAKHGMSTNI